MNNPDSHHEHGDTLRLRCVRQIADADDETIGIVSAVLARVPAISPPSRRGRRPRAVEGAGVEGGAK
ncbi:MAG: hypothetical protein JWO56_2835 [Acidobacteria bacterium]|nr:hypothetical protein [Acidobacteriota bacterium]